MKHAWCALVGSLAVGMGLPSALAQCPEGLYVQQVIPLLTPAGVAEKVIAAEGVIWVVQSGLAIKFAEVNGEWVTDSVVAVPLGSMRRFDGRRSVCVVDGWMYQQAGDGTPWSQWWYIDLGLNWPNWNQFGARLTASTVYYAYSGGQDFYNWASRPIGGGNPTFRGGEALGNQHFVSSSNRVGTARIWNGIGTFPGIGPTPMLSFVDVDISDTLSAAVYRQPGGQIVLASTLGGAQQNYAVTAEGSAFEASRCAAGASSVFALGWVAGMQTGESLVEFRVAADGQIRAVQDMHLGASGPMGADGDGLVAVTRANASTPSGRELLVIRRHQIIDCDGDGVDDCIATTSGLAPDINHNLVPDSCECLADLFVDGQVNGADLGILLNQWALGKSSISDIDRSGTVDGSDLSILLNSWGACP